MSVSCQCPSCKAKYQVGDQYAGRTVKCPKCSAGVPVPGGPATAKPAASGEVPVAKAATPAAKPAAALPKARTVPRVDDAPAKPARAVAAPVAEEAIDLEPPAAENGDSLGFLAGESSKSHRHNGARSRSALAEPEDEAVEGEDGMATISRLAAKAKASSHAPASSNIHRGKVKKKGLPGWVIPTIAGVAVLALVGGAMMIYMLSNKNPHTVATGHGASDVKGADKADAKYPVLTIDWPENERNGAVIFVDDEKHEVPATGAIELKLPPRKDQHRFSLQRNGYESQTFNLAVLENDHHTVRAWVAKQADYIDWPQQDFEAAKKEAASEHKNVLVLFDASDTKDASFPSSRFRESIASSKEFRDRSAKDYVCVYIDNPQKAAAQGRVSDAERNDELTKKFKVTVFPTIVVTDPKGRPFGIMENYKINGINAFMALMDKWNADRKVLFDLLGKIESGGDADTAGRALDFIELNHLDRFYAHTMKNLAAKLPGGQRVVTEEAATKWMNDFARAMRNPDEAKKVIEDFDRWKKTRVFKNRDMGAELHLLAAVILMRLGENHKNEAVEKCKEGLALDPQNPEVRGRLEMLQAYIAGGLVPAGSGTGFCIAGGNYVLTNHHVIAHAKEIKVHLDGEQKRYPAKLVADNEPGDMALLKVELPAGKSLTPIPLTPKGVVSGQDVCVLGFPGVMSQHSHLTFTRGVVSNIPDNLTDDESFIATDCKVNPGNSGGPACTFAGMVAGIVSRKSQINAKEDSYGLVIPIERVRKFLAEKLPGGSKALVPPPSSSPKLATDELVQKLSPSVVYIENLQNMKDLQRQAEAGEIE